jgi:hypothetical protein
MFRLQEKDRATQCGGMKGHSDVALGCVVLEVGC